MSASAPLDTTQQQERLAFLVEAIDGRRFKMVIKGDLHKLQVEKIRRYLKGNGVPDGLDLVYNGRVLRDDMVGEDFGLVPNAVLKLAAPGSVSGGGGDVLPPSSTQNTPSGSTRYRSSSQQQQQQRMMAMGSGGAASSAARSDPYSGAALSPSANNHHAVEVESRLKQLQEQYSDFSHNSHHHHTTSHYGGGAASSPAPAHGYGGGASSSSAAAVPPPPNQAEYYDPAQQERQLRMQRMTGSSTLLGGGGVGASTLHAPSEAPSGIQYSSANVSLTSHQYNAQSLGGSPAKAPAAGTVATAGSAAYGRLASNSSYQQQQQAAPSDARVSSLENENERLKREIESLKIDLQRKRQEHPPSDDMLFNAKANLLELSKDLGIHLAFDQNLTCVIGNDERNTVLITFDAATERLYLYSTVLTALPTNEGVRLKLFEALLDGAMLGRDMAGGGIGISTQNNIAMLCTSFSLRNGSQYALRDVTPAFLEALQRWRTVSADIVSAGASGGGGAGMMMMGGGY